MLGRCQVLCSSWYVVRQLRKKLALKSAQEKRDGETNIAASDETPPTVLKRSFEAATGSLVKEASFGPGEKSDGETG